MKKIVIIVVIIAVLGTIFYVMQNRTQSVSSTTNQTVSTPTDTPQAFETDTPTDSAPLSINDGIDAVVNQITSALSSRNASALQSLLVNQDIILGDESSTPQEVSKADAITWLNHHWTSNLVYVSKQYVEHFGYWEITTKGWSDVSGGEVDFRLFRFDTNGQRQAFSGNWTIYGISYQ